MYRVLYRKWRPQTFEEVYGQPHITATLKNELVSGRVAHAYLFTGSRGTGNTAWIEDIYVDETRRGQGIATRVIGLAEDKIKFHRGYTSICLEASPDNKAALALYHKLGYITLGMITVRKEIYKNDKKNETELFGLTYKY